MTGRLSDDHMDKLESWIGTGPKTFRLLYSFTRDGCGLQPFHSKCDNQGPTVTVVYNPQGSVYGGYTSLAWKNSGNWQRDDQAFLFQLEFSYQKLCRKFPSQNTANSVLHSFLYGPVFGSEHNLRLFHSLHNNLNPVNGVFPLSTAGGQMNTGTNYEYGGVKPADINNGTMDVVEGEVYSVTDGQRPSKTVPEEKSAAPWRKYPTLDETFLIKLREEVVTMTPPNVPEFRFLLTGSSLAGKSSFVNTVSSVVSGRIKQPVIAGIPTHAYTSYRLRTQAGTDLALRLYDSPGTRLTLVDMFFILDGHVPDRYQFNEGLPLSLKTPRFNKNPELKDEIHCVAVLVDANHVASLNDEIKKQLMDIIKLCGRKGIPMALLLTKIDKLDLDLNNDYTNVFNDQTLKRLVETVSGMFGVPENNVMLVKNYAQEVEVETDVDILALLALRRLQHLATDRLELLVSPEVAADSAVDLSNMSDTA